MTDAPTMRITIDDLTFRFHHLVPIGKKIASVRVDVDGSLFCALRDKPDYRHPYNPNPKYPWFCRCGYPEHETLMHLPSAKLEGK